MDEYLEAVRRELVLRAATTTGWTLDTLYLGGGTPSRLGGAGVARLLDVIRAHAELAPGAEVTLEANPEDVTPAAALEWRSSGINRISLGAQSLDDRALVWMHRSHDAAQVSRAVEAARGAGIESLSLDLIFALPEELGRDWTADVRGIVALAPEHVSVYGLTVEPGTPLARWRAAGAPAEAPEERYEREFLDASDALSDAGFEHYEVSNYARAGHRARHNGAYWRRVPYLGIGPAAHSFDGTRRWWNLAPFAAWQRALAAGRDPVDGAEVISDEGAVDERLYLGLRTREGIPADAGTARQVAPWVDAGWADLAHGRVRLTPSGWLRLDALAARLTGAGSLS